MNQSIFAAALGVSIIVIAGYFLFKGAPAVTQTPELSAATPWKITGVPAETREDKTNEVVRDAQSPAANVTLYQNATYGFSFRHPNDTKITELEDDSGDVIIADGGPQKSFQIFIMPFDEPMTVMTPERIRRDLPNAVIKNPQEAILGDPSINSGQVAYALIFESASDGIGQTREVWIVHNGFLYQITAPIVFDGELTRIMGTWKFE